MEKVTASPGRSNTSSCPTDESGKDVTFAERVEFGRSNSITCRDVTTSPVPPPPCGGPSRQSLAKRRAKPSVNTSHNAYYVNIEGWVGHEAGLGPCRYPLTPGRTRRQGKQCLADGLRNPCIELTTQRSLSNSPLSSICGPSLRGFGNRRRR